MPERVVIADLPKHPRIGASCGDNRDSANDSQDGYAMQYVGGYDKLFQLSGGRRGKKRISLSLHLKLGPSGRKACWGGGKTLCFPLERSKKETEAPFRFGQTWIFK